MSEKRKRWTREEDELILDLFQKMLIPEMVNVLQGRSTTAIRKRVHQLGIVYRTNRKKRGRDRAIFRFFSRTNKGSNRLGCWEWIGTITNEGYGVFGAEGGFSSAHRFSWKIHYGDIPDGLLVLHKCDNRRCVNPEHLFLGTQSDNMRDKIAKGRRRVPKPDL